MVTIEPKNLRYFFLSISRDSSVAYCGPFYEISGWADSPDDFSVGGALESSLSSSAAAVHDSGNEIFTPGA